MPNDDGSFDHTGKVTLVYHEPIRIKMVMEANKNPAFATLLATYDSDDWGGIVGEIAGFFAIGMEGNYLPAELDTLCEELYWRLVDLNKVNIITH